MSASSSTKWVLFPWALSLTAFLGTLFLHAAATWIFRDHFFARFLFLDPASYDQWAKRLVREGWQGKEAFYQDALYPYALAWFYKHFTQNFEAVRLAQHFLGAVGLVLIALNARRWYGAKAAGWTVGLGLASGIFWMYEWTLQKTALGLFLLAAVWWIYALARESAGWLAWGALGFLGGLLILVRGNYWALVPLGVIGAFATVKGGTWKRPLLKAFTLGACFLLGLFAGLLPSGWHNYRASGQWILGTVQGGQNFYIGNNPVANGAYMAPPFVLGTPRFERTGFQEEAERRLGRRLSDQEISSFWYQESLRWIGENPGGFGVLLGKKFLLLLGPAEIPDNMSYDFLGEFLPALRFWQVPFPLILALALIGLLEARKRAQPWLPIVFFSGMYVASLLLFFVVSRYRIPLVVGLLPPAGLGAHKVFESFCIWFTALKLKGPSESRSPRPSTLAPGPSLLLALGLGASLLSGWQERAGYRNHGYEQLGKQILETLEIQSEQAAEVGVALVTGEKVERLLGPDLEPWMEAFKGQLEPLVGKRNLAWGAVAMGGCLEWERKWQEAGRSYREGTVLGADPDATGRAFQRLFQKAGDEVALKGLWKEAYAAYGRAYQANARGCHLLGRLLLSTTHAGLPEAQKFRAEAEGPCADDPLVQAVMNVERYP